MAETKAKGWEILEYRRVFPTWSIAVPESFDELYVDDEPGWPYWHAFDEHRSISITSITLGDKGRPVPAAEVVGHLPLTKGTPVDEMPEGLVGRAVIVKAGRTARARKALSGLVAVDGSALTVTITSDDLDWTMMIWKSIQAWPRASRHQRRAAKMHSSCAPQSPWTRMSRRAS